MVTKNFFLPGSREAFCEAFLFTDQIIKTKFDHIVDRIEVIDRSYESEHLLRLFLSKVLPADID